VLTWLVVKTWLKKLAAWCKKYWQLLVGAAIPLVIWLLTMKSDNLDEVLERVREDHEKELDTINKSHEDEIRLRDEALTRFKDRLSQVERVFSAAKAELSKKKKQQVEDVLKRHDEDPDEITRRLAEITGFDVHVE